MQLTRTDLEHARSLLNAGNVSQMYGYLAGHGDRYAALANGVAQGDTFSGIMAREHLENTAVGLGMSWTDVEMRAVVDDMASAYLDWLDVSMGSSDILTTEISASEAWQFHNEVFTDLGLGSDAWTLNTPFGLMTDAERSTYWSEVLESAGDPVSEIQVGLATTGFMLQHSGEPNALNWLLNTYGPDAFADALQGAGISLEQLAQALGDANFDATGSAWWSALAYALLKTPAYALAGWGMLIDFVIDGTINPEVAERFRLAQQWLARRDPLTLDLDGDGIESVGVDQSNPILFDHDGDGIKHATGWISSDDGLLVLDRNGNGTIDSGRELFGDSTQLASGQTAEDGFAALAAEDTNGDGAVTAADARFDQLRVWRDLNQDGISQSGELFTLQELGTVRSGVAFHPW